MGTGTALFVLPFDQAGGAERVLALAAETLARRNGWRVEVIALGGGRHRFLAGECPTATLTVLEGSGRAASECRLLPRIMQRRFELVVSSHVRINASLALARRLKLLRCDRLVARESTVLADRHGGWRLLAYRGLYRCYGQQDLIVAQTRYMAERLADVLPPAAAARVAVLPNPVQAERIAAMARVPLAPEDEAALKPRPHILWCGRLIDVKQPGLALACLLAARRSSGLDLGLAMIGSGPLEGDLRRQASALGLSHRVRFHGQLANPFPIMAASSCGLVTAKREGFPNVLLEMMACGVPRIVTTACAGDLDMLEGVTVVERFDAEELAAALMRGGLPERDGDRYEMALAQRSAERFVDGLVGERSPATGAGEPGSG
jgi:glycosyltransferase involved in cell wall biosynthesis